MGRQMRITMSMLCSITRKETPRALSATIFSISVSSSVGFTPAAGSSRRIIAGSTMRTRASSSSFCWPPERVPARSPRLSARPQKASTSAARSRARRSSERTRPPAHQLFQNRSPAWPTGTSIAFSSTVMPAKGRGIWKERARPRRKILSGVCPSMRVPRKETVPAVGGSVPATMLNSVVLPAPLGPIRPVIVPAPTVRSTPSTAFMLPNDRTTPRSSSMNPAHRLTVYGAC